MAALIRRDRDPQVVLIDNTRTEHVTRTSVVHEHRAPTDASVALLKEMEAAAEKKLIEAVRVGNTTFECVLHKYMDCINNQVVVRAIFNLNGVTDTVEHRWSPYSDTGEVHGYRELRDKIAEAIATKMIGEALSHMR